MRCSDRAAAAVAIVTLLSLSARAQSPTYGVGRPPTPDEIKAWDIAVGPSGRELPAGNGTAEHGKTVYADKCARCHGATGKEGPQSVLVGGTGTLKTAKPLKTVGSYWPYATTLWDYVNRAMPFDRPGTLSADEVYASTAYVLFLNGLVGERDQIDANALRKLVMPNRNGFVSDPRPDIHVTTPSKKATKKGG
jgi:cytochrome c